jgi:hydroxyacyl-ACP dehydratase HTD2-like protein with hotdog domain
MAGLVPAIHVLLFANPKDVDARHKAGHDDLETPESYAPPLRAVRQVFDSAFFGANSAFRLSNNSTFTPLRRMMKLCCSTDSVLFQAQ